MGSKSRGPAAMVEEERASTSSELRHGVDGGVGDEHVATTSSAGATVEDQSDEVKASEDIVDRIGPEKEILEAGGSTPAKLPSSEAGGPHGSPLVEGSGSSVAVRADEPEKSKGKMKEGEPKNVMKVAHEVIDVAFDGEEARTYSIDEFGRILQTSQWSLVHRIEVCKVLECNKSNPWMMTPLSRQEYAKQSLALVHSTHDIKVNDISELNWPSFEEMLRVSTRPWEKCFSELRHDVEGHIFKDWTELIMVLEVELESLREKDKVEEWYKRALEGKDLQPWQIYTAVEKGQADTVHNVMMRQIGEEQWGKVKPREYRGATPLHWAALHNQVDGRLWELIHSDLWPEEIFDDFGFKPVHMAIFASSFLPGSYESTDDISKCLKMIDGYAAILTGDPELDPRQGEELCDIVTWELPCKRRSYGWNFVICPLTRSTSAGKWIDSTGSKEKAWIDSSSTIDTWDGLGDVNHVNFFIFKLALHKEKQEDNIEYTFVAKCYFNIPIHPLHLAIWIGHPLVVEKLIHSFKGMRHFSLKTKDGDTILHLASKAMDFGREDPIDETLVTDFPDESFMGSNYGDKIWSEDYVAKGMNYVARQQVMTIVMSCLHYYPHMLNSCNKDGQMPLHIAIFQGNLSCVRALLRCGYANTNSSNMKGFTPPELLLKFHHKDSEQYRRYVNILGRKCTLTEEVGFSTVKCNDEQYSYACESILNHFMLRLDSEISRQRQVLQLSEWDLKHKIYALQMLDENLVGLENIKVEFIKQSIKDLPMYDCSWWANPILNQSIDNASEVLKLKWIFIKISRSLYEFEGGALKQRIMTAITNDDYYEFKRLSKDETGEMFLGSVDNHHTSPLHWAILNGSMNILTLIFEKLIPYKESTESTKHQTWLEILNAKDEFGFTCLHLAIFYSFVRLDDRYKPNLLSDERFTSICKYECKATPFNAFKGLHHSAMIEMLHEMGFCHTDSNLRYPWVTFRVWNMNLSDGIHVDEYLTHTKLYPIHLAVHCAQPTEMERLLENTPEEAWAESNVKTGDTILHFAEGWEEVLKQCLKLKWGKIERILLRQLHDSKAVNSRNWNRETPLHRAVCTKSSKWVEVLLQFEHLRFNLRDQGILTPGDHAAKMSQATSSNAEVKKIVDLLDCYDPESWPRKRMSEEKQIEEDRKKLEEDRKTIEHLYRERQVYVDAGNAILVGGALIASASFGAWLQPPLGLHQYYSPEFLDTSAPPALGPTYDSYVAIQQYWTIQMFWIFNSLSFFFSLATVIAGADAALPHQTLDPRKALDSVKRAVKLAAWLLIASISVVICTFATVGFTVLPPISKYRTNMICTVVVGILACAPILLKLVRKLHS